MLHNYLKIAIRSLLRTKTHSLINILGLGIGIACCILIVLFVRDEWTFDTFHTKAHRIYRVWTLEAYGEDEKFFNSVTPFPMGKTLKENFAEVSHTVQFHESSALVKVGDKQISEVIQIASEDFFEVFDFTLISGSVKEALQSTSSVVLTRKMAQKYFGSEDPINKTMAIQLGERFEDFSVKAVLEDIPSNSSIRFGILISTQNNGKLYDERMQNGWFNIIPETYVLLNEGAAPSSLTPKFIPLFKTLLGPDFEGTYEVGLQPLLDIHLNNDFPAGIAPVSNPRYSYILAAVALLILIVACINFVTLSVGRSLKRAKEVGIRKVVGAERHQLIFQFIGEAVIVTLLALVVGFLTAILTLPLFNDLARKALSIELNYFMTGVALLMVVIIGLIAGSYPAFVLSNFRPVTIMKGSLNIGSSKQRMRYVLVGVQLVLSIFLISSTLIMRDQLKFLSNKDLGFNKEQLLIMQLNVSSGPEARFTQRLQDGFEKVEQFKIELAKIGGVASSFGASQGFGQGGWITIGYTDSQNNYRDFSLNVVDEDYLPGMQMTLVAGRNFSKDVSSDKRRSIIVNEALVREYGWKDAIGQRLPGTRFGDHEVIGVLKDFNFNSLYAQIEPVVLITDLEVLRSGIENIAINSSPVPKIMARISPGNVQQTIGQIEDVWNKLAPGEEFSFTFADEAMQRQYESDQNLGKIIGMATLLAIIIGGMGLYALASLAMQNRTKEISIRKVMGATEQSLLVLLSKDYFYLILICLVVSVPLTYYMMSSWLVTFEYRVEISWQIFLLAGGLSLVIAMITISYHAIKTAWTQPARTLKYE